MDRLPIVAVTLLVVFVLSLVLQLFFSYFPFVGGGNSAHIFIFWGLWVIIPGVIAIITLFTSSAKRLMSIFVAIISMCWFSYAMYLIPYLCEIHTNNVPTLTCYRLYFSSSYFREYVLD